MARKKVNDLPYNLDAEKAVLGAALLSLDALYNVISSLDYEDFYFSKHEKIFKAMKTLLERKTSVDVLTVSEYLMNSKELDEIGGVCIRG